MDFEPSDKVKRLEARLRAFMEAEIYPAEKVFEQEMAGQGPLAGAADHGETEGQGARRRAVEPVPARERIRRGPDQSRIRTLMRDYGALADRAGGVQLLGARYRQHGNAGPVCHKGAAGKMAEAAARRGNPFRLRDDRAGGGLV